MSRPDNRKPNELRPCEITPDFVHTADGSCHFSSRRLLLTLRISHCWVSPPSSMMNLPKPVMLRIENVSLLKVNFLNLIVYFLKYIIKKDFLSSCAS